MRSPNASSASAVGAELVAQLRDLGVRLVEVLDFLAQHVEVLAALAQRVHLPGGLLGELVDLAEPLVQRLERELLLGELVGLREQRFEPLGEAIDLLGQLDRGSCPWRRAPPSATRRRRPSVCSARSALVERLELLLPDRQRVHLAAHRLEQRRRVLASACRSRARPPAELGGASRAARRSPAASFSMRPIVSSAFAACFMPSLSLPICTSIAQTISLTRLAWTTACSTACCWLSSALALCETCSASAFSDAQPLFGALAQLVELRQRPELASRLPSPSPSRRSCPRALRATSRGSCA